MNKILGLWTNLKPKTKQVLIIGILSAGTAVIIAAMLTDNFQILIDAFTKKENVMEVLNFYPIHSPLNR